MRLTKREKKKSRKEEERKMELDNEKEEQETRLTQNVNKTRRNGGRKRSRYECVNKVKQNKA